MVGLTKTNKYARDTLPIESLYRGLCVVDVNTSRPPERSPTAHWAKRAYTRHRHRKPARVRLGQPFVYFVHSLNITTLTASSALSLFASFSCRASTLHNLKCKACEPPRAVPLSPNGITHAFRVSTYYGYILPSSRTWYFFKKFFKGYHLNLTKWTARKPL
jgi:hypothetical protein